jgi:DNA-binding transcriptional MocR family regulator
MLGGTTLRYQGGLAVCVGDAAHPCLSPLGSPRLTAGAGRFSSISDFKNPTMPLQFASRLQSVETSAIRVGCSSCWTNQISFAGWNLDPAMFDVATFRRPPQGTERGRRCAQYGATEGYRCGSSAQLSSRKGMAVAPAELIVTTGSQQALDLLGKP